MIKVFLSHQHRDSHVAYRIRDRLKNIHQIESYLDVIDPHLDSPGDSLASHLQREISKCTHLIAITSIYTRASQWVPWEIGIATEKQYPLATFADYTESIPEFLQAWPYLRNLTDLDEYAKVAKISRMQNHVAKSWTEQNELQKKEFRNFYNSLRSRLGQPIVKAR